MSTYSVYARSWLWRRAPRHRWIKHTDSALDPGPGEVRRSQAPKWQEVDPGRHHQRPAPRLPRAQWDKGYQMSAGSALMWTCSPNRAFSVNVFTKQTDTLHHTSVTTHNFICSLVWRSGVIARLDSGTVGQISSWCTAVVRRELITVNSVWNYTFTLMHTECWSDLWFHTNFCG